MKKFIFLMIVLFVFISCQRSDREIVLQNKVDSLIQALRNTYKPGFGESMIQLHYHFGEIAQANKENNWDYIAFEIKEMHEVIENIKKYQDKRPETPFLTMIDKPIELLTKSVEKKDSLQFKNTYNLVHKSCNDCHKKTHYGFIKIKNSLN